MAELWESKVRNATEVVGMCDKSAGPDLAKATIYASILSNQAILDAKLDRLLTAQQPNLNRDLETWKRLDEILSRLPPALEQVKCGACQGAGILEGKEHSYCPDCGGSGIKDGFKDCKGTGKRP